ncbi:transposable element Tc3 transposase [Trichonephila clavipes]|nr:transposable element Tc3 transposase [Trichonephila clavipes]
MNQSIDIERKSNQAQGKLTISKLRSFNGSIKIGQATSKAWKRSIKIEQPNVQPERYSIIKYTIIERVIEHLPSCITLQMSPILMSRGSFINRKCEPHCSSKTVKSVARILVRGLRVTTCHRRASQTCSIGLRIKDEGRETETYTFKNDEAHFWLNGYVNNQNCRIWRKTNPQVYVETPLHPEKLTVWCALRAGGIIGPYSFKNDEGHNVTVNGDRYRAMITNFFIPELNNHDVQSLVYVDKPQTLDHLEDNIRRVIADIRPQMLEKVIENWTSRLDYIRASSTPEIIFKM